MIGNSGIRVSQLLGFACFLVGAVVLIVGYVRRAKGQLQTIENESVQALQRMKTTRLNAVIHCVKKYLKKLKKVVDRYNVL